jgi:hypothetical protein
MNDTRLELLRSEEVFANVLALYYSLKSNPSLSLKNIDTTDFLCDIEIKARRTLTSLQYQMFLRLAEDGSYDVLPTNLKQELGKVFLKTNLGVGGHYRVLYFKAKNARLHETIGQDRMSFPEEIVTPEDII